MITKKEIMVLGSGISGIGSVMLAKKMDIDVFLSEGNIIDEDTKKTLRNEHIDFEENGHDPKTSHNFAFVVPLFLEVVMDRCH